MESEFGKFELPVSSSEIRAVNFFCFNVKSLTFFSASNAFSSFSLHEIFGLVNKTTRNIIKNLILYIPILLTINFVIYIGIR